MFLSVALSFSDISASGQAQVHNTDMNVERIKPTSVNKLKRDKRGENADADNFPSLCNTTFSLITGCTAASV